MKKKLKIGNDIGLIENKDEVTLLPGKIIAVGLNYRDHAKELRMAIPKEPVIFLKPNTTVIGHLDDIIYPKGSSQIDYEAELAVIIKKTARNISKQDHKQFVLGYTCANDITARDLQKRDVQWTRAKSFDTFCPLGPVVTDEIDPENVRIRLFLNGQLKQDSSTANMIFNVGDIISFISSVMTLLPGDVILTGTPVGVGSMKAGDSVEVEVEGIGKLKNNVRVEGHNEI